MNSQDTLAAQMAVAEAYRVDCPDVLEVRVANRPDLCWQSTIGPDGRLPVPALGQPRVEGRTLEEVGNTIAGATEVDPQDVAVRVVGYRSQVVYLFGQVKGSPRSVSYHGPETVLELLQRTGGITPGAEPTNVHVIRPHVADGKRPEVFQVDLRSIVMDHNHSTNIRLHPYDQIYVGETREAKIERCCPRWLRPLLQAIFDTRPDDRPHKTMLGKRLSAVRHKIGR